MLIKLDRQLDLAFLAAADKEHGLQPGSSSVGRGRLDTGILTLCDSTLTIGGDAVWAVAALIQGA